MVDSEQQVINFVQSYQNIDSLDKRDQALEKSNLNPIVSYLRDISLKKMPPKLLPFHRNQRVLHEGAGDSVRNQRGIGMKSFLVN